MARRGTAGARGVPPIGRPIRGCRVYVVDRALRPVPPGAAGELCLAGDSLARGYHRRPAWTARAFVPDPFGDEGGRLYRTGDLVRHRPAGELDFLGRIDHQVQVRGVRVEPGEVEALLGRHGQVRHAVLVPVEDAGLVACVVSEAPEESLRQSLEGRLPEAMVPTAFVFLEALPLLPTGKVDRRALVTRAGAALAERREAGFTAPRTPAEELLAGIWADVLGTAKVGLRDDFFALGGHSLLATQVISRLRDVFGVELPVRSIFEDPTVERLARRVEATERRDPEPIPHAARDPRGMPLSFAQQRLWFLDRLLPESAFYNVPVALRLHGDLDAAALAAALDEIVRRHESLRTTFAEGGGGAPGELAAVQVVHPFVRGSLPRIDLRRLPAPRREAETRRLATEEAGHPFDLRHGPLYRNVLLELDAPEGGGHVLLLTQHHIVADGWSAGILFSELAALYEAFSAGRPSPLPELRVQYGDFALWQRGWLAGKELERQLDYWRRQLGEEPPRLELPTDRPRPAVQAFRGGMTELQLPAGLTAELASYGRRRSATLAMTLLAGFYVLLHRMTGQEKLLVGSPVANRNRSETEGLIGFFVNSLTMVGEVSGRPSFRQLLGRVREMALGAYAHQDLPFEKLVEELALERDLSRNPLFQVVFTLQNAPMATLALGGLRLEPLESDFQSTRFDLEMHFWQAGDGEGLRGFCAFDRDLFDSTTVERLGRRYRILLDAALRRPGTPVTALTWLSAAERHQLRFEWGTSTTVAPEARLSRTGEATAGPLVHELVRRAGRRRPDAVAVTAGDATLTFGELARRANAVARRLVELGVGPESTVAVCLPRSARMVTALLGVLEAGAAYLPLDPAYPAKRLAWMARDGGAGVLITDRDLAGRVFGAAEGGARRPVVHPQDCGGHPEPPRPRVRPGNPAYVIYTSGSTGRPKGVVVPHAALTNLVAWHARAFAVTAADRSTQVAAPGFDAAVWEIWPCLAAGATLHLVDDPMALTPGELRDALLAHRATVSFLPTPLAEAVLAEAWLAAAPLRLLLTGGDRLHAPPVGARPFTLVNNYGPTENAVVATSGPVPPGAAQDRPPAIGRPVDGVCALVLDRALRPVPAGIPGELCLGGAGLARGYLKRPAETARRFVPWAGGGAGGRLYRTGDLARFVADGTIEFLGRTDHQVKVRGVRVELGEVEAALASHPAVRDAVAALREEPGGERRLIAWVAAEKDDAGLRSEESDQVEQWQAVFDEHVYRDQDLGDGDPTFNVAGWKSTYTGEPLGAEVMREWLDDRLDRLRALLAPQAAQQGLGAPPARQGLGAPPARRRVLEIGCGTGMILFGLAPHFAEYWGTDFSRASLRYVEEVLARPGHHVDGVRLLEREAHELSGLGTRSFDGVVLNSVVQYFPGLDYLLRVLEGAVEKVVPGGFLFLGDLRSLPLLETFHASLELANAPPGTSRGDLLRRARAGMVRETELALDPALFPRLVERLPRVTAAEVHLQRGRRVHELTRFRYDVVLRVEGGDGASLRDEEGRRDACGPSTEPDQDGAAAGEVRWLDWRHEGLDLEGLRRRLAADEPALLGLARLPNRRLWEERRLLRWLAGEGDAATVGELRGQLRRIEPREEVDPAALRDLAEELGYRFAASFSGEAPREGDFDVLLSRDGGPRAAARPCRATGVRRPLARLANAPLHARLAGRLVPALREALAGSLPEAMVPSSFVVLDALPLTPHGKVDRAALPPPEGFAAAVATATAVAPRTGTEEKLASIWSEVLGVERVGTADDFFASGGHSLLATRVVSRVRDAFHVELPVRALFETPTVAGLARQIDTLSGRAETPAGPPLTPVPRDGGSLPLSFAQQRLYFLDRLVPGSPFYNMPLALSLRGGLDAAALEAALDEIVRRHEVLRTTFAEVEGRPVQLVHGFVPRVLARVDLAALPAPRREAEAKRLAGREAARPFDLGAGPLQRATLLQLAGKGLPTAGQAPDVHVLLLTHHHVVSDGWSFGVFCRELAALYDGGARLRRDEAFSKGPGAPPGPSPSRRRRAGARPLRRRRTHLPLPELAIQYADFAVWQRSYLRGEVLEAQLAWWKAQLGAEPPLLQLPLDRPRPAVQAFRGAAQELRLPASLAAALDALGRARGTTLAMTLLAGFFTLLHRITGQEKLLVGSPVANRNRSETEDLIGFFVNSLTMVGDVSGRPGFPELLDRVREMALDAFAHQDLPFEKLVEDLGLARDLSRNPIFQVVFALQNAPMEPLELKGLTLEPLESGFQSTRFDLELHLFEDDGLQGACAYDAALFDATTVRRLLASYRILLEGIAAAPESPVDALEWLSAAERHQLRTEWSTGRTGRVSEGLVHELFAARAAADPGAVAVVDGGTHTTYGELERRANGLAHWLARLLAAPEPVVAVCLPRSATMLTACLAVMKAGAAYLPLDPGYPRRRLVWMVRDAGGVVVTDRLRAATVFTADDLDVLTHEGCPERHTPVVVGRASGATPAARPRAASPAYVIYTSGSTGQPKGVAVPHAALSNLVAWHREAFAVTSGDRATVLAGPSFDASVWEVWPYLTAGATLHLLHDVAAATPAELRDEILEQRVTVCFLPTPLAEAVVREKWPGRAPLRYLLTGGDRLHAPPPPGLPFTVVNNYGPTESTVVTTSTVVPPGGGDDRLPAIGRPIAGLSVHLVDRLARTVPIAATGELTIGGAGLARGYLGRPGLTAERFVPAPGGGRLYRTGDLARHLADGSIEFLGRFDHQVQVHGLRIELGEVKATLLAELGVREAVVTASDGERLTAYVVPDLETAAERLKSQEVEELPAQQVEEWRAVFDDHVYREEVLGDGDPTFNIAGWKSTYTGELLGAAAMREWLDDRVERLLGQLAPRAAGGRSYVGAPPARRRRVLEIGCGTGMILFAVAPHCDEYVASDLARASLDYVARVLAQEEHHVPGVRLLERPAHDFSDLAPRSFDGVILNSVIQYFPSLDYLLEVLTGAFELLVPGGFLFLGDVRSFPLLEAFHASLELHHAAPSTSREELARRTRAGIESESELAVDPALFPALQRPAEGDGKAPLPRLAGVEVHVERGRLHHELNRFRYDVVLHADEVRRAAGTPAVRWLDYPWARLDLEGLRRRLAPAGGGEAPALLGLRRVPNARLREERHALHWLAGEGEAATVGEWRDEMRHKAHAEDDVDPAVLAELAAELGYRIDTSFSPEAPHEGSLDVLLSRPGTLPVPALCLPLVEPTGDLPAPVRGKMTQFRRFSYHANNPIHGRLGERLVPSLRESLAESLPAFMVPSAFVVLDSLPLTPNGKVDFAALPAPEEARVHTRARYAAPRTPVEEHLAAVWQELLGQERVSVEDDFFELGGHSLLATRVVSRIRDALHVELGVRSLFETPTVAGLARQVERLLAAGDVAPAPAVRPVPRDGARPLPLSFAQQRLYFLDRLMPGRAFYNMPFALRLQGGLRPPALAAALTEIVRRHEVLRTTFAEADDGTVVQLVQAPADTPLPRVELRRLGAGTRQAEARRLARREAGRPFDLAAGPLLRNVLLLLGGAEHVLLLTQHHITSDGWSFGIFCRELAALYEAFCDGRRSPLPELPVQYADFAIWQRGWLRGEVLEKQIRWWKDRLGDAPPVLELPTDRPRPAVHQLRGGALEVKLPPDLGEALRRLGREENATLAMTLLAGFFAFLHRVTGQDVVVVGAPVAGRNRGETEGLIGFFVNTLPMVGDLRGGLTFRQLLRRVAETALGAYAHQDVPFEKLVEELGIERDLSRSPIFQVLFGLLNLPLAPMELSGLHLEPLDHDFHSTRFDLAVNLLESGEGSGLFGSCTYDKNLFDTTTVVRLLGVYRTLLSGFVAAPDEGVAGAALSGAAERHQVLVEWNDVFLEESTFVSVVELFRRQAARTPDAAAVVCEDRRLTFAALAERTTALAARLRALGGRPEVRIGLCLERSCELVAGIAGILEAGAVYVPLDPAHPRRRLALQAAEANLRAIVTRAGLRHRLPETGVEIVDVDSLPRPATGIRSAAVRGENAAYVIFTSGSTGRPKVVVVEHRQLADYLRASIPRLGVAPEASWSTLATISADAGIQAIFTCLTAGGTLHLLRDETIADARQVVARFAAQPVDVLKIVPSFFALLFDESPEVLPRRLLLLGGEVSSWELVRRVRAAAPGLRVSNQYGPAETTVHLTAYHVPLRRRRTTKPPSDRYPDRTGALPIGRPLPGTRVYVFDRRLQPVPAGVPGELGLAGVNVARGYLGRPAATAESFVPEPNAPLAGGRLYRTGDRVRFRADGRLDFLGRIDSQLKVRGFRVEPGEVESVLAAHAAVRQAVVSILEGAGGAVLVAWVVADPRPTTEELRGHLGNSLPEALVPSAFVFPDALPRLPNGKVDRAALSRESPDLLRSGAAERFVAPRTPTEKILADIWRDVLAVERIGTADNFFQLGGHSLLAIRIVSRVRDACRVELPLRTLFEAPTVAGLGRRLEALRAAGAPAAGCSGITPLPRDGGPLPLSFAQQRLWFLDRLVPGSAFYNMPVALRLVGRLHQAALAAALTAIVRRHEVLRTTLHQVDEEPVQVVHPAAESPLPAGPSPLPELGVQYADFAVWQRATLQGEVLEEQLAWWRALHGDEPDVLELPTDRPRPAVQTFRGAFLTAVLPGELASRLHALSREADATLAMTLLAAFTTLLFRTTGQERMIVGSPVAGRNRSELEGLIGFFVNTLPMVADLGPAGRPAFREVLARTRDMALGAYAHQDLPFEKLVDELGLERDLSRNPLFQVVFTLQNAPSQALELPGLTLEPLESGFQSTRFDLEVHFAERDGGIAVFCTYDTDLFDATTVHRLTRRFQTLCTGIVARPDARVTELPWLGAAERHQVLVEWGESEAPEVPPEGDERGVSGVTLTGVFAQQVVRHPGAVAVVCGDEELTWRELARQAARLARQLRALGVGTEVRVGLELERSTERVVAILGVLEAGGAYVPLDPGAPPERRAAILEDACPALVLDAGRMAELRRQTDPVTVALPAVPAAATAYVIFTSGSTGRPKGVAVSHANVLRLFAATRERFRFSSEDVWTMFHSYAFDFSVWELWGALLHGGRLVVVPYPVSRSPADFRRLLRERRVTVLNQTPSAFGQLVRADADAADAGELSLRLVIFGGEALDLESLAPWIARHGDEKPRLVNMYGITETTVHVTWRRIRSADVENARGRSVVGPAIPDLVLRLLDRRGRPVGVGVVGEIHVGGAGVARGYLGRGGLTAERFVPDPWSPGGRLYRSGDLARHLGDGDLEYLGRADFQVQVRGFRVEPGEIEAALERLPTVREAVVTASDDAPVRLTAFVVTEPEADAAGLRRALAGRLPEYMVPAAFVHVDAVPLTANGKVNRAALQRLAPGPGSREAPRGSAVPRTPEEQVVADAFRDLLGIAEVGLDDSFFELGGDSILATRVVARMRSLLDAEIPLRDLFTGATVAQLARQAVAGRGQVEDVPPLGRGIPDVQLLVLNPAGRLAGVGELGEIAVRSPHLARGYLDPELTHERFTANPFTAAEDDRIYRSGDLGRYLPDGEVAFAGRADRQVKIRGFRVELAEIEAVVAEHPEVAECAVLARQAGAEMDRQLTACVVAAAGASRSELSARLGVHVRERLPGYMVPAVFVDLEAVPLTPTGKVDRNALERLVDRDAAGTAVAVAAPRTETEARMAEMCRELLGGRHLELDDDFFDVGGHSLLAVRLLGRIRNELGVEVALQDLFRAPTVAGLAARVDALRGGLAAAAGEVAGSPLVEIRPGSRADAPPFFCVHPAGGNVLCYARLARHLDLPGSFYGLQAQGLAEGQEPLATIEEQARLYLDAVRRLRPAGPYHLGGWSMGGLVAYEMARRLAAAGEEVAALALLDAGPLSPPAGEDESLYSAASPLLPELDLPAEKLGEWRHLEAEEQTARVWQRLRELRLLPEDTEIPRQVEAQDLRILGLFLANIRAFWSYRPRPWAGPLTLFVPAEGRPWKEHVPAAQRWAAVGVEVEQVTVPGTHLTLITEPHVRELAAKLRPLLE